MNNGSPAVARLLALVLSLALGAAAMIGGCTGGGCDRAIERAGRAAGEKLALAQWIGAVDPACAGEAERVWAERLRTECAAVYAFHAARTGAERPGQCDNPAFDSAWNLGGMLDEMERERADIRNRLEEPSLAAETRRDLNRRLVVIERDLPQIEALARMDGYLPPADVPDTE